MIATAVAPLAFLLVTPHSPALFAQESCLTTSYHGQFGHDSVFLVSDDCLAWAGDFLEGGSVVPLEDMQGQQLVWLEHKAVDESLVGSSLDEITQFIAGLQHATPEAAIVSGAQQQHVLTNERPALLAVPSSLAHTIDAHLPRFWKATPIPSAPVSYVPVPADARARVRELLASIAFDPVVASVVGNISVPVMQADVRYLTGEDPKSGLVSRHSFSQGALDAADWLKEQFESTGATCELKPFLDGFAPNVICAYEATEDTTETLLLSAHYDSRGSFGSTRAPGGDDDGSGTTALLAIARTIARKGITFRKNVQLCAFAGEEQGLLGSKAYAREMREKDADLTLMIQADMLAYHAAGEPPQLGLPKYIGTTEVAELVSNLSAIYSPELMVGFTSACCSDHQSFHEQGFPATQIFERAGPVADPMYHNSGDLSDRPGYDFEQLRSIAKVQFATLLHAAGFDLPE
ncbi:hypothetical protein POSPLADRAFT_1186519 [Postia placenta MAD-698-R-SB12]|uniref:Peptide hydrolase n=1 Tax=Postia placenta MAD-698-R-SB12 TaxID=670580 RepID=A0A1X6MJY4_9APHY|nr:hypothetical protein POSPLADRAFT_1186519 [Postia placenta MAD-698-R-SB12]OSX56694.1 hypothetical protein POSPLADRAFT_1186519 [Postia placenta MAD-698-R-SB12]